MKSLHFRTHEILTLSHKCLKFFINDMSTIYCLILKYSAFEISVLHCTLQYSECRAYYPYTRYTCPMCYIEIGPRTKLRNICSFVGMKVSFFLVTCVHDHVYVKKFEFERQIWISNKNANIVIFLSKFI